MNVCKINVLTLYVGDTIIINAVQGKRNTTPPTASQKHQRQGGNTMNTNETTAQAKTNSTPMFETIKRNYETALASGNDSTQELITLATAIAYSVVNKCIDPQRKNAMQQNIASSSGYNPAMVELKKGIAADIALLRNTQRAANTATTLSYNADGDLMTVVTDKDAADALINLMANTLTDGVDLVQTAALAILEQSAEHANGENWLDSKYTVRRLSRRVYIRMEDSAAYKDDVTTPIQEAYRAVRQAIQNSRAVQTNPRNGYSYIDDMTPDGLETIYRRMGKYIDMGGYDCNGNYTTDKQTAIDYDTLVSKLSLTDRQAQILRLRMQGKGYKAIATYLGVCQNAIVKTVKQIQKKAIAAGLTPHDHN